MKTKRKKDLIQVKMQKEDQEIEEHQHTTKIENCKKNECHIDKVKREAKQRSKRETRNLSRQDVKIGAKY